ncbi:glycosyltransferase family 61 protein [Algoriphagus halophytocola]|uniref:Glycosyltransferase family 61 protein n=1 Tax=Algoriphagus halophytocola TaxID=2991499 RepID=A0ABY6MI28_9BACT|nr:glycosyltransferase family 61 protein [Algoriphagus sp. TR-M5]UZD22072.1 glycosyltransferase family 61 protein [Algoriphagus sp. TR-M5]
MAQEISVKRDLPENLSSQDRELFEDSLQTNFLVLPLLHLKKVAILQDTVFCPKKLKFYAAHTHVNSLGFLPLAKRVVHCFPKKWRKIDHGIWIKDEWSANYFHWMTDCLPRLWMGLEQGISDRVILHDSFQHIPYVTQSLKLLQINPLYYHSKENLWVENLILTPRTATFPNFNIKYTRKTRAVFSPKASKPPHKKIYVSRKLAPKRKAHNELDVELLVRKKGYEIIYAEKLSVKQQIELMAETKTLVALHGAALTNMLFMQEGQNVIELRNIGDSETQCYFNLANALKLNYFYTLNQGDFHDTIMTDFTIDLQALEEVLDLLEK